VPIFAGVAHQRWVHVVPPIALASAIWYGALVSLGAWAGQNLDLLGRLLGRVQWVLAGAAGLFGVLAVLWWWHSRHPPRE
jgi:membrane protein DedA with SNARE-associated domain